MLHSIAVTALPTFGAGRRPEAWRTVASRFAFFVCESGGPPPPRRFGSRSDGAGRQSFGRPPVHPTNVRTQYSLGNRLRHADAPNFLNADDISTSWCGVSSGSHGSCRSDVANCEQPSARKGGTMRSEDRSSTGSTERTSSAAVAADRLLACTAVTALLNQVQEGL